MSSKLSDIYQILAVAGTTTETADTYVSNEAIDLSLHVQAFSASTSSATILVQQSVDGTNWYTSYTFTNPTSTGEYVIGPIAPYNRLKLSAHASGTVSAIMTTTSNRQTEWKSITAQDSSASAGGSNDQVQTNDSGSLSGSNKLTFDETTLALTGNETITGTLLVGGNLTNSTLTATRVPYAGAAGLLKDNAALTFTEGSGTLAATTFSGALTGNVTGNVAGTLTGGQKDDTGVLAGDGPVAVAPKSYFITKGSALGASTVATPTTPAQDGTIMRFVATTAFNHVLTFGAGVINGGANTTLTFTSGAVGDSVTIEAKGGVFYTIGSHGTITVT